VSIGGGRRVGLFYCLILSDVLAIDAVAVVKRGGGEDQNKTTAKSFLHHSCVFSFSVIIKSS
jgi:hypothetical protein